MVVSYRRVGYIEQIWYMFKWWLKNRKTKDDEHAP